MAIENNYSLLDEFQMLELEALKLKVLVMKSLSEDFTKTVFIEFQKVKSLSKAFNDMNILYYQFFKSLRYSNYQQFINQLK